MISSKTVNDLTEIIVHSHRQLIHVRGSDSVHYVNVEGSNRIFNFFFILRLLEFARLFATMASVNLIFPPQKRSSNETLKRDTRGFNAGFSHWLSSVSVVQFTLQMSKLNGLGKTHRERMKVHPLIQL